MTRTTKKIAYGIFWNALLAAILLAVYFVFIRSSASCSDGTRNQGEQGVDCGGPCVSCEAKNLLSIRTIREVEIFRTAAGKVTLLAAVLNPNTGYIASEFPYEIALFDSKGNVLELISGTDTLFASETRYLVSGAAETPAKKIARATLTVGTPQWKPKKEFLRPDITVLAGAQTTIENGVVFVRGTVKDQSTISARSVRIVAFLLDRSGNELFVNQTVLSGLAGGGEAPFTVQFPADSSLTTRVDADATRLTVVSR